MGAFAGVVRQGVILSLQFGGHTVALGLVEQFVDFGDRYALRAGRAVVAVGAVASFVGIGTQANVGIVFLGLGSVKPMEVGLQLIKVVDAEDAGADARFGKAVGDALLGSVSHTEWRCLGVKQTTAAAKGLHHGDTDIVRSAVVIEFHADGIDARLQVFHSPLVPRNSTAAQTVESRIEREHNDLDPSTLGGTQRNFGIVAADTYMLDFALFLQLEHIFEEWAAVQLVPLFVAVGDMNHTHLDMVGAQTLKQVLKTLASLLDIAGAGVLPVLKDGADMPLDDHLVATTLKGVANVGTRLGVGVIDVDVVHTAVERHSHKLERCGAVELLKATAADTDFTDHQAGVAQRTVFHKGFLLPLSAANHGQCDTEHQS